MKSSVVFERDNSYHNKWYVSDSCSILVTGGGGLFKGTEVEILSP